MKYIFVNLKRFDVPPELGGINRLVLPSKWAETIISKIGAGLEKYSQDNVSFTFFFPEAHIVQAVAAKGGFPLSVGCQGIHWDDTVKGGNFGAFTTLRPAAAMTALGCTQVIIGHCEERRAVAAILAEGDIDSNTAATVINRILGKEIAAAKSRNLEVLYCIGEKSEEQEYWQEVLSAQIEAGLSMAPDGKIIIAYEPVWAIGPGKTPPDRAYIEKVARFIKGKTKEIFGFQRVPVVYGGGLKTDNAAMLASIPEIDGGLIALTRFSGEIGFYPEEYLEIVNQYLHGTTVL
jgi:triosephosphate isomerase